MAMAELALRPPQLRVSRRAVAYWTVRAIPGWLVLLAIEASVGFGANWSNQVAMAVLGGTAGLALVHLAVMPQWRYRVHRWERTSEAVYTQAGWFTVERRIAPISRIQTVDSHMGLWERIFSLSNVTITTASAAGPLHIHGLDRRTARDLLDDLIRDTQASPGDAT
jgi:membrane protein YdbS with pleckstrin-like domain